MIHIVENKAYKSDSDRSLRSYYDKLRERIEAADFNVNNLTLEIKETLEYINSVNEMLEEFRVELLGDVEEIRPFLPEKQKTNLDGTPDKIKEALQGNDIKDITKEIEDASTCLAACQSCFTGTFDRCINVDNCAFTYDSGNTCIDCVSEQIGCRFCDSDQNTCVIEDNPCMDDYSSACTSCYQKLYNSCSQEQITCNYDAGCTNCQNNVQSCNRCFTTTYSTCSNCYSGSYGVCGEEQVNPCGSDYQDIFCNSNIDPQCSSEFTPPGDCGAIWKATCNRAYESCIQDYYYCTKSDIICRSGQGKCIGYNPTTGSCNKDYAETCGRNIGSGTSCATNYDSDSCQSSYQKTCSSSDESVYCDKDYGKNCDRQNTVCEKSYNSGNTVCSGGYKSDPYGEVNCKSSYTGASGWETCMEDFDGHACKAGYRDLDGVVCQSGYVPGDPPGCQSGYSKGVVTCDDCYGTAYGCSGCYDVAYCSKCNTTQAFCTSCVKGQTTCEACVKGEEGHSEDVCSNCYGGCQATWEQQKDCFTGSYGTPPACTICNIGCQYCDTGCYSGQSCGDCGSSNCGSGNCGASNCGSGNCGTANCGTGQCNQSGCENCDDVSACLCSHTGSYGCNFPMHS